MILLQFTYVTITLVQKKTNFIHDFCSSEVKASELRLLISSEQMIVLTISQQLPVSKSLKSNFDRLHLTLYLLDKTCIFTVDQ